MDRTHSERPIVIFYSRGAFCISIPPINPCAQEPPKISHHRRKFKKVEAPNKHFPSQESTRQSMSARIRHSSLLLRKYDWIFCECINTHQPARRALHIKNDATKPEIHEPSSPKPLVRRLEGVLATLQSATAGSTIEDAIKGGAAKPRGQPARKRPRGPRMRKVLSEAALGEDVRISRIKMKGTAPLVRRIDMESGAASGEDLRISTVESERITPLVRKIDMEPRAQAEHGLQPRLSSQVSTLSTEIPELGKNPLPEKTRFQRRLQGYLEGPELGNSHRRRKARRARKGRQRLKERLPKSLDDSTTGETSSKSLSTSQHTSFRKVGVPLAPFRKITPSFRKIDTDYIPAPVTRRKRLLKFSSSVPTAKRTLRKAIKRQQLLTTQGFRKVTTEKHPLFRKVPVETVPAVEYAREHALKNMDFRLEDRPLVRALERFTIRKIKAPERRRAGLRRAKPLVRMHLSASLRDLPTAVTNKLGLAQNPDEAKQVLIIRTKAAPLPLKITKYGSLRMRKHEIVIPKFTEPLIIRTNRQEHGHPVVRRVRSESDLGTESIQNPEREADVKLATDSSGDAEGTKPSDGRSIIRRAIGFEDVEDGVGQPLVPKRIPNLVPQKVSSSPKGAPPLVRFQDSKSPYSLPSVSTKALSELIPERSPIRLLYRNSAESENVEPPNLFERKELEIQAALEKRKLRDAWLVRKGEVRLAISLKFSADSLAKVQRLRNKYNPSIRPFVGFKVLRRLDIGEYAAYQKTLEKFVGKREPFAVKLNAPARAQEKAQYRVGLQLEFEPLEQLEQNLLEMINKYRGLTPVTRRNTRDNDELGMMVISGKIDKAEEAEYLMGLLELEHMKGLGDLRVEGLVLHGYVQAGDTLFPPPVEFMFTGEKKEVKEQPAPLDWRDKLRWRQLKEAARKIGIRAQ